MQVLMKFLQIILQIILETDFIKIKRIHLNVTIRGFLVVGKKQNVPTIKKKLMLLLQSAQPCPLNQVVQELLKPPIPAMPKAVVARLALKSPRSPRGLDATNASSSRWQD